MMHRIRARMATVALFLSLVLISGLASAATFSISPTSRNHTSSAGSSGFTLTGTSGGGFLDLCSHSVTSNAAWITITSVELGFGCGSHTVSYSYTANSTLLSRTGTITAGGKTYTVTQAGISIILPITCLFPAYSISPSSKSVGSSASTGTVSVTDSDSCGWTAVSNASWIHVTAGASGSGNGTVSYSVDTNLGVARTGTVTIAGKTFTVTQNAGLILCLLPTISPSSQTFSANGGNGSVAVNSMTGCSWTAASNNPACIFDVSPGSGSGDGTVNFSVAGNAGTVGMSCTMTIGGQTFTANLSGCTFSLGSSSASVGAGATTGSVSVNASGWACNWSATSNAPSWITVTSGAGGPGSGNVGYSLAANTGAARTGTITVAGQTFTITQAEAALVPQATTTEFYHAGFGHYFVTASADEAAVIDAGVAIKGWVRTGQSYSVFAANSAGLSTVCRFFTITFAPKSSHFYTPNVAECTLVKSNPDWQFEGNVFYVNEPAGGSCPGGTVPLYRVYNNGRSGAPNHRYTTCSNIRDNMIARGWVSEGVAMCVPSGSANCAIDNSGGGVNYNADY